MIMYELPKNKSTIACSILAYTACSILAYQVRQCKELSLNPGDGTLQEEENCTAKMSRITSAKYLYVVIYISMCVLRGKTGSSFPFKERNLQGELTGLL